MSKTFVRGSILSLATFALLLPAVPATAQTITGTDPTPTYPGKKGNVATSSSTSTSDILSLLLSVVMS